ncbi:MAG TPA: type II toxin-antitoxin system PemK/MazF family toxin [Dermatophilaceae bacterium]|nr:type II toxin-antitoxin system PemK/MazF family toxin [Dermatophilaceae bacterium]
MPLTFQSVRRRFADLLRPPGDRTGGNRSRRDRSAAGGVPAPEGTRSYPGDATRLPDTAYRPSPDGDPDPGEILWAWVPFEEDHTVGKDRPVLVIGHEDGWLVGLSLTSRDHDRDEHRERTAGREWVDIGTGPWDPRGRPSEVRVNRLLRVDPATVRREGAVLDESRYAAVVRAARDLAKPA